MPVGMGLRSRIAVSESRDINISGLISLHLSL